MEDLDLLVQEMRRRSGFEFARQMLRERNLPIGRGWKGIQEQLRAMSDSDRLSFVEDFMEASPKTVFVLSRDGLLGKRLAKAVKELQPDNSWSYSQLVSGTKFELPADPTLVRTRASEAGLSAVVVDSATLVETTPLPSEAIKDEYIEEGATIQMKREFTSPSIEQIVVSAKWVTVQLDSTTRGRAAGTRAADQLLRVVDAICDDSLKDLKTINFFPSISNLYHGEIGRVALLRFDCGSDVNRREYVNRRDDSITDLRTEAYHVAGTNSLKGFHLYRIAVEIQSGVDPDRRLRFRLHGTRRDYYGAKNLFSFEIEDFAYQDDVERITEIVIQHLDGDDD